MAEGEVGGNIINSKIKMQKSKLQLKKSNLFNRKLEEKKAVQPGWRESDFVKTIDGQIMIMLKKAVKHKHFIEAQALSWATIEQLLLPRLISWIAKVLKINLPNEIYKLNSQNINFLYLCISHDEALYKKLEEGRKQRNKIVHRLTLLGDTTSINNLAKNCTKTNMLIQQEIMKRFNGIVFIPSINLYKNGWNDALNSCIKIIKSV